MADDRERNQGMRQGGKGTGAGEQGAQGGTHQAPGRNPQDDRSAGGQKKEGDQGSEFDPNRGGDGGSYKEGGQNEETRR